ncbi:uncharacterized protein HD556DRAFT_1449960 [Suillus plorans]|uniref:Uncharacterized protein n=1 Tax=Suillus plorans TaxID=116603 RepID=A0A9P7ABZ5_9AGAM|nr:uncharacterized protein HD556DRAFT_1449960 [Suillus plorans]KAG1786223.1 hypothetical protein HD556DRAFT_1449960 [Suillus plorans]
MDLQPQLTAPIFLYMPSISCVLQVIQSPNAAHPFVGFSESERYLVIGYMAHQYCEISPIYCPDYAVVTGLEALLPIVGVLAIHQHGDTVFYTVYEKQLGDGNFLRATETQFCRPNAAGIASPLWIASDLQDPIRFNPATFPFGFPPPIVTNMVPIPTQSVMDGQFASAPQSVGPNWSAKYDHVIDNGDYITTALLGYVEDSSIPPREPEEPEYFGVISPTVPAVYSPALVWKGTDILLHNDDRKAIKNSMNSSVWKRPMFLTKCLFQGSLWVGLGNPFDPACQEDRVMLTNCFLEAISLDRTSLQQLVNHPVILQSPLAHLPAGASIGWDTIRLTFFGTIENKLSELRKIVWGCIRLKSEFSGDSSDERDKKVKFFFDLFNSNDQDDIELAIAQLVELHMYKELMWGSSLQTLSGLTEGCPAGRITNLFPEEVRGGNMALGKRFASMLLTVIYHTFHLWQPAKTPGRRPETMYHVILNAVTHMYANPHQFPKFMKTMARLLFIRVVNVFPIDPKSLAPRSAVSEKRQRTLSDIKPIMQTEVDFPELPNAAFTSVRSQRIKEVAATSCFEDDS